MILLQQNRHVSVDLAAMKLVEFRKFNHLAVPRPSHRHSTVEDLDSGTPPCRRVVLRDELNSFIAEFEHSIVRATGKHIVERVYRRDQLPPIKPILVQAKRLWIDAAKQHRNCEGPFVVAAGIAIMTRARRRRFAEETIVIPQPTHQGGTGPWQATASYVVKWLRRLDLDVWYAPGRMD